MGRTTAGSKLPRGITTRETSEGTRLQIAFTYMGDECRELLPPAKITKAYIEYAVGLRAEIKRKIADGTFNYRAYFPDSPRAARYEAPTPVLTLGPLLRRQLATYEKQAENGTISPSTLLGYSKIIKGRLLPQWEHTTLSDLTPSVLRPWIAGMGVTGKTLRNILTPLRSVLDDAVNDELIEVNPLDRIALRKLVRQTAKKSDYEVDPFDHEDVDALLRAARDDERPMVAFWLETGLRPGEIIAMEWPSIDFVHKTVRIESNEVTGLVDGKAARVKKSPKTASGVRDVELSEAALAALGEQKAKTFLAGGRVWHNPRTGLPWESDAQFRKTLWEPLCKRAGVRYRNPYQLRHTFASTRLTDGANPWWLASQMGHVDVEMVFKVYGKFIPKNYQRRFAPVSHGGSAGHRVASTSD